MKCLMKYDCVKLLRSHLPQGKRVMGAYARLSSRAAFRKGQAEYCGHINSVNPGEWSGGIVGVKSILGIKSKSEALKTLDKLSSLGYITYTLDRESCKIKRPKNRKGKHLNYEERINKKENNIMKTAIIYYSKHHSNTKKLLDAIAERNDVTLIDVTDTAVTDLSGYDRIGFASGIYYSKFQKALLKFAEEHMPDGKETFFIYTYGAKKNGYTKAITEAVSKHGAKLIGEFGCFGYNTFGPFKLIGGIAKGHPDKTDFENALKFYEGL